MLRKWICTIGAIGMVFAAAGQASAAERTGSAYIQPLWCGAPVFGDMVSVCRVGTRTADGIILSDGLANWEMREEELWAADWASWLVQKKLPDKIVCAVGETGAAFTDLSSGVYLVQMEEENGISFEPFFLLIPEGENWDVYRSPKLLRQEEPPKTGDRPTPLVGAMGIGLSVAFLMVFVDEHRK